MVIVSTRKQDPAHWAYRWFAGRPLDGNRRTNCSALRAGTKPIHADAVVRSWSYLPGWKRSAVRQLGLLAVAAGAYGRLRHPVLLAVTLLVLAVIVLVRGGFRAHAAFSNWQVNRLYIRPLHDVLVPTLNLPGAITPADYISVPATFATNEKTPVRITMPRQFPSTAANKDLVTQVVLPKLGRNTDNTDVRFESIGQTVAIFKMAPEPPKMVRWADQLDAIAALPRGSIFVGLGARNAPYVRDFSEGEVVHGGFNGLPGSGKSVSVVSWVAQILHQDPDARATFIDPKQSNFPTCLVGVPGYVLANDPDNVPEMWERIREVEAEMDRRRVARLNNPTLEFSYFFLILDELSEFADMTKDLWDETREKEDPKRAPIWRSIARIMRMGREFGMRVLVFTQRLDSASTGGFGLRDLFGWRGLSKFKKNQWMMLVGTTPVPKAVNHPGRWIYTDGQEERWVQNVLASPQELRDWAMSHVPTPREPQGDESIAAEGGTPVIVGLEAGAEYLGIEVEAFRKRRARAEGIPGEFRKGNQPAWPTDALDAFDTREEAK